MLGNKRPATHWLPYVLVWLMALPPNASAQAPASAEQGTPAPPAATVQSLKVIALTSNQSMNDLERKVMAPLVVQIVDQNDQPVEGADVIFRFPLDGPSASFAGQKGAQTFRSNADGQAAAIGWTANGKVGAFQIQVTASRGNEQGSATISMTNVTRIADASKQPRKHWWSSKWAKIGIIAGAAGIIVAIVLATTGSSGPRVVVATPGSPTIGGPQ
jgi:hypothetical protein